MMFLTNRTLAVLLFKQFIVLFRSYPVLVSEIPVPSFLFWSHPHCSAIAFAKPEYVIDRRYPLSLLGLM